MFLILIGFKNWVKQMPVIKAFEKMFLFSCKVGQDITGNQSGKHANELREIRIYWV